MGRAAVLGATGEAPGTRPNLDRRSERRRWLACARMARRAGIQPLVGSIVAVGIAVGASLESLAEAHRLSPPATVAGLVCGACLLPRRRFPFLGPVAALVAVAAVMPWADLAYWRSTVLAAAGLVALWRLGRDNEFPAALLGLLIAAPCIAAPQLLAPAAAGLNPVASGTLSAGCWLAAVIVRRQTGSASDLGAKAQRVASSRQAEAAAAIAAERATIARELHDVISHTLTVMTLQASGARMVLDSDPDRALEALRAVETAGREALGELRKLVDVLDGEDRPSLEPLPGMRRLDRLVEEMRSAGLQVEARVDQGPWSPSGRGVDVAAYRVAQEALTNALRHGRGPAALRVEYLGEAIVIEVLNEVGAPFGHGSGNGLIGMQERVALYGGSLQAGAQPDGSYALRARIPVAAR